LCFVDDNNVAFFKVAVEAGGELQDAESYYQAVKSTVERENAIGLGTDDPPVMRACRKKVRILIYCLSCHCCLCYCCICVLYGADACYVDAYFVPSSRSKTLTQKDLGFYAAGIRWTTLAL
jgi:hypothetical protein